MMTLYGRTCVERVLLNHADGDEGDRTLEGKGIMEMLLRPPAWTRAYAWQTAGASRDCWDSGDCSTHFAGSDKGNEMLKASSTFMTGLRLARTGAINQGVLTSASLSIDGRARVDAFIDRWHCRRSAQRSGHKLAAVLKHLAQNVRMRMLSAHFARWTRNAGTPPLLRVSLRRPKLFLLLDMHRSAVLHKNLTAWGLLTRRLSADRALTRTRGVRVLGLLARRETRREMIAVGLKRWRYAVQIWRDLERRKEASFERWKLFLLLGRHHLSWGVERAMRVLHGIWVKRLVFSHLLRWRTSQVAARALRDAVITSLLRAAWVSLWGAVVRDKVVAHAWFLLGRKMTNTRRNMAIASKHCRTKLIRKMFLHWLEASKGLNLVLRKAFERWMGHFAHARENISARKAIMSRLSAARGSKLQRQALLRWMQAEGKNATASLPRPEQTPACLSSPPTSVCRCVRCLRRYGRMGGRANRPRTGSARRSRAVVVTESRCDVDEHLELQLRSARRTIDQALRRAAHAGR